jgi:hypothetical protein
MATKQTKLPNGPHSNHYKALWQAWQTELHGPYPTEQALSDVHALGCSPGKQAMAIAMAMREGGASRRQIMLASGLFDGNPSGQFNKLKLMIANGTFTQLSAGGVYKVELTKAGAEMVARGATRTARVTPSITHLNGGQPVANPNTVGSAKPAKAPAKAADAPKPEGAVTKPPKAKAASKPRKAKVSRRQIMLASGQAPAEIKPVTAPEAPRMVLTGEGEATPLVAAPELAS